MRIVIDDLAGPEIAALLEEHTAEQKSMQSIRRGIASLAVAAHHRQGPGVGRRLGLYKLRHM